MFGNLSVWWIGVACVTVTAFTQFCVSRLSDGSKSPTRSDLMSHNHPGPAMRLADQGLDRSAIAIHAWELDGGFALRAAVFAPDGSEREDAFLHVTSMPARNAACDVGLEAGADLRRRAARMLASS